MEDNKNVYLYPTIDLGLHTRLHNVIVIINIKTLKS
jgi:hypothetical protein